MIAYVNRLILIQIGLWYREQLYNSYLDLGITIDQSVFLIV